MSTNDYFEAIGMWPRAARHMQRSYILGFILSLILTLGAYEIVVQHWLSSNAIVPVVLVFACFQLIVQVLNFLHVSGEKSSRERLIALLCAGVIMLILVLGSMWIMSNLDSRMSPNAAQMEQYMNRQQGI